MLPHPRRCGRRRRDACGFTLLELVVALAIGAILALLATSGYQTTLLRSHRLDARAALVAVATAQERHYLEQGRYASRFVPRTGDRDASAGADGAEGGAGGDETAEATDGLPLAPLSAEGRYVLELAADADAFGYTAIARPRGAQLRDRPCSRLTLDHTGRRTASDARGADTSEICWK